MKIRLYVNFLDDPQRRFWCWDEGDFETGGTVRCFRLHGISGRSVTRPYRKGKQAPGPHAWVEIRGVKLVSVIDHVLHVYGSRCNAT